MDKIFGAAPVPASANPPAPAPNGTGQPGNIPPTPTNPATPGNGVVPDGSGVSPNPNASPLDSFTDLWKNEPNPNAPAGNESFFNVNPAQIMEAAKKMNFSQSVSPEQMQAIVAGGEGAVKAFTEAMNNIAQTTFAQSTLASTKILEAALGKAEKSYDAKLPNLVKDMNITESLRADNPAFSHPAALPIIEGIKSQLLQKHPMATSAELTEMAKTYFDSFTKSFTKPTVTPNNSSGNQEVDWSNFF